MNAENLRIREITKQDIPCIISYWQNASPGFLKGMGADPAKLPDPKQWEEMLREQIDKPYTEKASYCLIWLVDGKPSGHCNVNKIIFGKEAFMHLHLWDVSFRGTGMATKLVKMTLPFFFKNLDLKTLYSEPYALNPAPNNTLKKVGFNFVKEYITTPGILNFEQPVKLWELTEECFLSF